MAGSPPIQPGESHACDYCGASPDPDNPRPWRCRRCGALVSWEPEPPPGEPIPFGPYRLVRRIAAGGMGVVYEARRKTVADFEKAFALKRLLPALTHDADFIAMMVEEAKICVQLEHPNVVQVFELDKVDTEYYIAMEYVAGGNFAMMLRFSAATRRLLPVPVVAYMMVEALKGLGYAHGSGRGGKEEGTFIHRDVSPQNIMVGRDARVKITDFGIAKAIASSTASRIGSVKGKLAYMAPELLTGARATPRVDVFAMGVVMHEALASRRLFRAETEAALVSCVLRAPVPPLARYRDDVPRGFERVIRTALVRDPELRYPNAGALRQDLVEALPPGMVEQGSREAEQYIEDFYRLAGLPGEPLNPAADGPLNTRSSAAQAESSFKPSFSDSFPTVASKPRPKSRGLLRAALVGIVLLVIAGTAGGLFLARDRLRLGDDAGAIAPVAKDGPAPVAADAGQAVADPALDAAAAKPVADTGPEGQPDAKPKPRRALSIRDIERTFKRHMGALNSCAARFRAALPPGGVKVALTIGRQGSVKQAVLTPASLRGTGLDKCLAKVVAKMRFPRHNKPEARVTVPLNFQVD